MTINSRDAVTLELPAALNIRNISEIYSSILGELSKNSRSTLAIAPDAQVDLSFVQLVEAARCYAREHGKQVELARPAEGALHDVLQRGGFLDDISPETAKFWLHQETV